MRITDVLRGKGTQVVTVPPDTKVRRLLEVLAEHWYRRRRRVAGRRLRSAGSSASGTSCGRSPSAAPRVMSEPVTAIYTAEVHTITPDTSLDEVMRMMTERRVRHAPVVTDGALHGIVSIGKVVKNRIDELETERAHLTDYITGTR